MGNRSSSDFIRYEDVKIRNNSVYHFILKNTRVVKGMAKNVISLLQLVKYGWNKTIDVKNGTKIINMQPNNSLYSFVGRKKPNLCFLEATVVDTKFIWSVINNDNI